jgi:DNA-binding CsgD family transcriptional regulator
MTARGHPAGVVAKELHLTEEGVRQLLSSVYRKIGTDATGLAHALQTFPRPVT